MYHIKSNCPNGPDEIIKHNYNGFKYKLKNLEDLENKLLDFDNLTENNYFK